MTADEDRAIVGRLRSGDRDALREVYETHHRAILALAAAMLGRTDTAWDALQDVFVSFARVARNLSPDTDLRRYLLTAGANRARDLLSPRRNVHQRRENDLEALENASTPPSLDPAAVAQDKEEAARLWECLMALPDEQRVVVALRIYAGLTLKEVSEREGISENTAASRYRYALKDIRRKLREAER